MTANETNILEFLEGAKKFSLYHHFKEIMNRV